MTNIPAMITRDGYEMWDWITEQQWEAIKRLAAHEDNTWPVSDLLNETQPVIGCGGVIAVPWCGMYVCIEPDGRGHT